MKNKKRFIFSCLIITIFFNIGLASERIDYSSNKIKILENGKVISGEGDVQIIIDNNIFISSETFEYSNETGLYRIFNDVKFKDSENNIEASGSEFIFSSFDNKISSNTKSKVIYNETYNIELNNFEYDINDQKINSDDFVKIKDI